VYNVYFLRCIYTRPYYNQTTVAFRDVWSARVLICSFLVACNCIQVRSLGSSNFPLSVSANWHRPPAQLPCLVSWVTVPLAWWFMWFQLARRTPVHTPALTGNRLHYFGLAVYRQWNRLPHVCTKLFVGLY